jgi:hypothetical protein
MRDAKQDAINFCNNMKAKGTVSVDVAAAYLVINNLLDYVDELEKALQLFDPGMNSLGSAE